MKILDGYVWYAINHNLKKITPDPVKNFNLSLQSFGPTHILWSNYLTEGAHSL